MREVRTVYESKGASTQSTLEDLIFWRRMRMEARWERSAN